MDIQLLRPHTHDGREYAAGDALTIDDSIAAWIIRKKIARISGHPREGGNIDKKALDALVKPEHDRENSKTKGGKSRWVQNLTR